MNKAAKIGIVAPNSQARDHLRQVVETSELGHVSVESGEYGAASDSTLVDRFQKVCPEIVLVDAQDPNRMLETVSLLHEALPESWIFVTSDRNDSGLILSTVRAGAREFLVKPVSAEDFAGAVNRYFAEAARKETSVEQGKIYSVASSKGGSGSTSLAVNLTAAISQLSNTKAALVDLEQPFGDASTFLNLSGPFTVADALNSDARLDSVLLESFMSHAAGFDVLPAAQEVHQREVPDLKAIQKILNVFQDTYTHTIVDLPTAFNYDQLTLFSNLSQEILVVLTPELTSVSRAHRLLRFLDRCGGLDKVRLVLNRTTKADEITSKEIEETLEWPVYWSLPNDYRASIEALNAGKPTVYLNHSLLASSYTELAGDLTGITTNIKRKGLLGLFS